MNDKLDTVVDLFHNNNSNTRNDERKVGDILVPKLPNKLLFQIAVIDYAIEEFGWEVDKWEEFRAILKAGVADEEDLKDFDYLFLSGVEWIAWSLPDHLDVDETNNQLVIKEHNGSQN